MKALEQELQQAIAFRNELAVELAGWLLRLASDDGQNYWLTHQMTSAFGGYPDRLLANVEALTAVILNRAGMPWDAIAAQAERSKQSLHRRHAVRGEKLYGEALSQFGGKARTTDTRVLSDALFAAEEMIYDNGDETEMESDLHRSVPWASAEMISTLVTLPASEFILRAGNRLAAALVKYRKIRRWWWLSGDELNAK